MTSVTINSRTSTAVLPRGSVVVSLRAWDGTRWRAVPGWTPAGAVVLQAKVYADLAGEVTVELIPTPVIEETEGAPAGSIGYEVVAAGTSIGVYAVADVASITLGPQHRISAPVPWVSAVVVETTPGDGLVLAGREMSVDGTVARTGDVDALDGRIDAEHDRAVAAEGGLGAEIDAVASDLGDHTGETTTAHGGIVGDDDPRLDDARSPLAHALSHAVGGTDPVPPAAIGAARADQVGTWREVLRVAGPSTSWLELDLVLPAPAVRVRVSWWDIRRSGGSGGNFRALNMTLNATADIYRLAPATSGEIASLPVGRFGEVSPGSQGVIDISASSTLHAVVRAWSSATILNGTPGSFEAIGAAIGLAGPITSVQLLGIPGAPAIGGIITVEVADT